MLEVRVRIHKSEVDNQFLGPVGELALVTLGNRMGHCMGLRMGYSMSTILYFFWLILFYLLLFNQLKTT